MTENVNRAPYPQELADLVDHCQYRPGWEVRLRDFERDEGCTGLSLVITTDTFDTYSPQRPIRVNHIWPVPAATYNRLSWQRWLFDHFLLVEQHECQEFFQIGGARPYAPMHGPGNDPYLIPEYHDEVQRRTTFRGEIQESVEVTP